MQFPRTGLLPVPPPVQTGRMPPPVWLAAALAGYAVFLFAPPVLNDSDTFLHLAAGEWIIRHASVPATDPFSYTFAGAPWVAHEWLSELVMACACRLGGWSGLLILFGSTTALTAGLLARHLGRWLEPLPATVALVAGMACVAPSLLARPHILALPLLELWTAGLLIARERSGVPWRLLPLMTVWANLHGSFVFGLALACPFAVEAVAAAGGGWRREAGRWGLFLAAAVALATVTPQGWHGLVFPFQLMSLHNLSRIGEWQATDFQTTQPLELALMAALYVCLSRGVRLPVLRLLLLMGLLHLALQHARHQLLVGITGTLVFAEALGRAPATTPAANQTWTRGGRLSLAGVLAIAVALTTLRLAHPVVPADIAGTPAAAVAHVPAELAARPVLNDYGFGSYLIFRGVRPFIDSRADLYGDAFLTAYGELMRPDRARLEQTLDRRGIGWTILEAGSPTVAVMDALPGWHRLYADEIAVVHVRNAPP